MYKTSSNINKFVWYCFKHNITGDYNDRLSTNDWEARIYTYSSTQPMFNSSYPQGEIHLAKDPNGSVDGAALISSQEVQDLVNAGVPSTFASPVLVAAYGLVHSSGDKIILNMDDNNFTLSLANNNFSTYKYANNTANWAIVQFYNFNNADGDDDQHYEIVVPVSNSSGNGVVKVDANNNLVGLSFKMNIGDINA